MTELEKQLLEALKHIQGEAGMAWDNDVFSPARAAIAAAEATSLQPTVAVVPDFPGRVSIADLDYAQKLKPESWSDEHFETWQLLQVASRNVTRLHIYARQLRAMLEAAHATVKDSLIVQQAHAVPDGFVLVQRSPDKAVCLDGGRFHGWLMYRHPDGQFVSERKLQPWEVKEAGARLAAEAQEGGAE
ncbi:hypothetical protein [Chromobacterium haemolyticum]|uniref:hypothetical protein n=1 Tax=Chromobacterium haemolyticum TaxID=394935 RepID=UPI001319644C|nr:hypothetical protein [Chromobacterium haemolyticum]BBH11785.1 hypothetical protein CH06BL_10330 [Chromobacterium haemolyticum]